MSESVRILAVDDDPDVRELLGDYLSEQGYQVLSADSAAAARELLAGERPEVVLLDVGLPGEDGLSLARYIREHFDIGIIMVSGAGDTVDRIVGLEVGADDYLAKPFDPRGAQGKAEMRVAPLPANGPAQAAGCGCGDTADPPGRCRLMCAGSRQPATLRCPRK